MTRTRRRCGNLCGQAAEQKKLMPIHFRGGVSILASTLDLAVYLCLCKARTAPGAFISMVSCPGLKRTILPLTTFASVLQDVGFLDSPDLARAATGSSARNNNNFGERGKLLPEHKCIRSERDGGNYYPPGLGAHEPRLVSGLRH